jgi:hypothetical protein
MYFPIIGAENTHKTFHLVDYGCGQKPDEKFKTFETQSSETPLLSSGTQQDRLQYATAYRKLQAVMQHRLVHHRNTSNYEL